jgi:DNA-binding IclR family transcriptional regulator
MSSTFLRGLGLLEIIDRHGPMTVTELARTSDVDKATISRVVSACVANGWVVRQDRKIALGPRCALLGRHGSGSDVIEAGEALVQALFGATGLLSQAYGLVGGQVVLLASATGQAAGFPSGEPLMHLLHATATGKAIAAQLDAAELDALLPSDPLPGAADLAANLSNTDAGASLRRHLPTGSTTRSSAVATTRREFDEQLAQVRDSGVAFDRGDVFPTVACIAVPWPRPNLPAALACLGTPAQIAARDELTLRCLRTAARPASIPRDVLAEAIGA